MTEHSEDDNEQTDDAQGFEKYSRTARREKFLTEMDRIVPWGELWALIAPVYPSPRRVDGCKAD
ncbi:MAG: hypothetical protein ACREXR_19695 [Gammaproteobacteria bacterium]